MNGLIVPAVPVVVFPGGFVGGIAGICDAEATGPDPGDGQGPACAATTADKVEQDGEPATTLNGLTPGFGPFPPRGVGGGGSELLHPETSATKSAVAKIRIDALFITGFRPLRPRNREQPMRCAVCIRYNVSSN
jgi:hypothetical protein